MTDVDIITPAYNSADTVVQTVESVLAQTYSRWKHWVVDDGSQDDTADLVARTSSDPRLQLVRQDNRGAAHARNLPLDQIRGDYVAFLDSDDYWHPEFLSALVPVLEENPEVGMVWSDLEFFGNRGGTCRVGPPVVDGAEETLAEIYSRVTFLPSCCLFRASFFREGLRWRQECSPMEDMPIFFEVAKRSRIAHVDRILAYYRVHAGSMTTGQGAVGRNYPSMVHTFRNLYQTHRDYVSRRAYHERLGWIYHCAADNRICAGKPALSLLLRALRHRPTSTVTWKVLAKTFWPRTSASS